MSDKRKTKLNKTKIESNEEIDGKIKLFTFIILNKNYIFKNKI